MKLETLRDIKKLYVYKGDELAGVLARTEHGAAFTYAANYIEQNRSDHRSDIAFTLPCTDQPVTIAGDNVHPFFAGLLPEGRRLSALVTVIKTSQDDLFTLLAASGLDCIGDISVSPTEELPEKNQVPPIDTVSKVSFSELFENSISASNYSARLHDPSVAGIHPKISAEMISFPVAIKRKNYRYLLKLAPEEYPLLIQNEHFFMELAGKCGLPVAPTQIVHDRSGQPGLLVNRFDRQFEKNTKRMRKLHQEDACQFLNRYPQDKYRLSMREIGEGIAKYATAPIIEIGKLLQLKAFSYLIGNGDLHAKNISLLTDPSSGRVTLSPAYDLLSTFPYGDQNMALMMEGRKDNLRPHDFISFGEAFGVRAKATVSILKEVTQRMTPFVDHISEIGFEEKKTSLLKKTMKKRLGDLR